MEMRAKAIQQLMEVPLERGQWNRSKRSLVVPTRPCLKRIGLGFVDERSRTNKQTSVGLYATCLRPSLPFVVATRCQETLIPTGDNMSGWMAASSELNGVVP